MNMKVVGAIVRSMAFGAVFTFAILFCIFPVYLIVIDSMSESITQEVLFYEEFSNNNLEDVHKLIEFCDKQNYDFIYDKEEQILEVELDYETFEFNIVKGKLELPNEKQYLKNALFLKNNPNAYEKIERNGNEIEYVYKDIIKTETKNGDKVVLTEYEYLESSEEEGHFLDYLSLIIYIIITLVLIKNNLKKLKAKVKPK